MEKRVYRGEWSNWESLRKDFRNDAPEKEPSKVFAVYNFEGYDGSALVLYVKNRKWAVVEASHCSCYGLEDQWEPTFHQKVEIDKMLTASYGLFHDYSKEISEWMK